MKKIFSKSIFKQSLKKLSIASALIGLISVMITVVLIGSRYTGKYYPRFDFYFKLLGSRAYTAVGIAPALLVVMFASSLILTYMIFSYQNRRSSSDKVHSLPYTKTQQFVSRISAVLVLQYAIIMITMLAAFISTKTVGSNFIPRYIFLSTLGYMAGSTLIAGAAATAMSITGNWFANLTTTAVILFLPRCILFVIGALLDRLSMGFINLSYTNIFINPTANIPVGLVLDAVKLWEYNGMSEILINVQSIIYTFVLAILYIALAGFLSNKRKSELAGKSFISSKISYIFAALCAMPLVIYSGYIVLSAYIDSSIGIFTFKPALVIIVLAFVLFIIISFIYNGRINKLSKGTAIFSTISIIVLIAMGFGCVLSNSAFHKTFEKEKIEYVKIDLSGYRGYINTPVYTYGMLKAKDVEIKDEVVINSILKNIDLSIESIDCINEGNGRMYPSTEVWCEFHFKNGTKTARNILIFDGLEMTDLLYFILNNEEYVDAALSLPQMSEIENYTIGDMYATLDDEKIVKCALDELNSIDNEQRRILPHYLERYLYGSYNDYGSIGSVDIYGRSNGYAFINRLSIDNNLPKTQSVYVNTVNDINKDSLDKAMRILKISNIENMELGIDIYLYSKNYDINKYDYSLYFSNRGGNIDSKDTMLEILSKLTETDISKFPSANYYAELKINLYDPTWDDTRIYLESFYPITDAQYEQYYEMAKPN